MHAAFLPNSLPATKSDPHTTPGNALPVEKAPGHWVLARLGKRVLRPGGLELTRQLLGALEIGPTDDVVEFAPGLGITARMAIERRPRSYTAVERDADAAQIVRSWLGIGARCLLGTAEHSGLPTGSASVVYGEAMLSMQSMEAKTRIIREANRLLRPGGRYGIHELCLVPDSIPEELAAEIHAALSEAIHAGVRPLTRAQWRSLLTENGFSLHREAAAPMHLLEPRRIVQDEGIPGAARFAWNLLRDPGARRRVMAMRRVFCRYRANLAAGVWVARKTEECHP